MNKIKSTLDNDKFIAEGSVNSWFHHYYQWLYNTHRADLTPPNCTEGKHLICNTISTDIILS